MSVLTPPALRAPAHTSAPEDRYLTIAGLGQHVAPLQIQSPSSAKRSVCAQMSMFPARADACRRHDTPLLPDAPTIRLQFGLHESNSNQSLP